MVTAFPLVVSFFLFGVGLLLPGCSCCDDCGQDVFDEVYVSYDITHVAVSEGRTEQYDYYSDDFPEHWYRPASLLGQFRDAFFVFGTVPQRNGTATIVTQQSVDSSFSASGQVACINIGKSKTGRYPDNPDTTILDQWRYIYNASYVGTGCDYSGVDVEVRPSCPSKDPIGDVWRVTCFSCANRRSAGSQNGDPNDLNSPKALRIPSQSQRSALRVDIYPSSSFSNFPLSDGWTNAVKATDLLESSSVPLVPESPAVHGLPTKESISYDIVLGASFFATFNFNDIPKQSTTKTFSSVSSRVHYLADAASTILGGGSPVVHTISPCSPIACVSSIGTTTITSANFWNSSWADYTNSVSRVKNIFEISGSPVSLNRVGVGTGEYYLLKNVIQNSITLNPQFGAGGGVVGAVRSTAGTINLSFE